MLIKTVGSGLKVQLLGLVGRQEIGLHVILFWA